MYLFKVFLFKNLFENILKNLYIFKYLHSKSLTTRYEIPLY